MSFCSSLTVAEHASKPWGAALVRKDANQSLAVADDNANATKVNGGDSAPTIDQVRELLFGDANRTIDARLEALSKKVDKQYSEIMDRFSQLEARLVAMQSESEERRLSSIEDIGEAITKLGATVRNMSTARKG